MKSFSKGALRPPRFALAITPSTSRRIFCSSSSLRLSFSSSNAISTERLRPHRSQTTFSMYAAISPDFSRAMRESGSVSLISLSLPNSIFAVLSKLYSRRL